MKRFLPDSIAGWVIVVLISGLAVSQVVTLAIHYNTRSRAEAVLEHFRLAERIADVVRLIETADEAQRPPLLAAFTSGTLHVAWSGAPAVDDIETADARAKLFSDILQAALWDVPWRTLRVSFTPAQPRSAAELPGGRPTNRTTRVGRSLDDILTQHARVPVLRLALQLDDASWLNFEAPFVETSGTLSAESLLLLGLVALIVVGLSIWAVRRLTAPLETLARAAEQLGRDVHAAPLSEGGAREMRQATHAFNLMQERLQRFVHDRMQMTAAISHDLRTPITRLRLRAEFVEDEEQRRKLLRDLDDMEAMIDATLAFTREEASTEAMASVDLVSLAETVCEDRAEVTLELGASIEPRLLCICRPVAMRRCLANLVDNAVKYGYSARVRLELASEFVTIRIDDDGPGVPVADQERVFAPFERLDSSRNSDSGGTGLGLSIARAIARAHGGDVTIENRREGGLRVTLSLPRPS